MEKLKVQDIVNACIDWNNRKITAEDAMVKIFKTNQNYILSKLNAKNNPRKCGWCGKRLPESSTTYCDKQCMIYDRRKK